MKTLFIAQLRTSKQIRQSRQDSRHDIPGQRLVSGQQLPSGIGALDPSGHLLVLHLSTSHPISFSLASSHLETLGSHGRKLMAEPLILPCTTKAVDKLLPRRVIITIPNIFPLFVTLFCFVFDLSSSESHRQYTPPQPPPTSDWLSSFWPSCSSCLPTNLPTNGNPELQLGGTLTLTSFSCIVPPCIKVLSSIVPPCQWNNAAWESKSRQSSTCAVQPRSGRRGTI